MKHNTLSTIDYISRARSTNVSRYNINEVFRDETALVATDGHRLHFADNLPKLEAHYPSGSDAKFPDWRMAVPNTTPTSTLTLNNDATKSLIAALKGMLALMTPAERKRSAYSARFDLMNRKVLFDNAECSLVYTPELLILEGVPQIGTYNLNISYLLDAIIPDVHAQDTQILFYGEPLSYSPVRINTFAERPVSALIMPVRDK